MRNCSAPVLLLAVLCQTLGGSGSWAAEAGDECERGGVLFYAGFDKSKDAGFSALGPVKAIERAGGGRLTLDGFDSMRRQAFKTGDGVGYVEYEVDKDIVLDEGTIEMWIRPENYGKGDGKGRHVYIEMPCEGGGMIRYSLWPDNVTVFEVRGANTPEIKHWDDTRLGKSPPRIVNHAYGSTMYPGKYMQVFMIWKKGKRLAYYHARPQNPRPGWLPVHKTKDTKPNVPSPGKLKSIRIGDFRGKKGRGAGSIIDEVYIYNRALSYDECNWLNDNWNSRANGMDVPSGFMKAKLDILPDPRKSEIEVTVDSARLNDEIHGTVRLEPAGGAKPAQIIPNGKRFGAARIAYAKTPPAGEYKVIAELKDAKGKDLGTVERPLTIPDVARWIGNKVGISDTPPPPWTPLKATKNTVNVWGRKYTLADLGLLGDIRFAGPEKIQSKSLLAGPVELALLGEAGKPLPWTEKSRKIKTRGTVEADISGVSQAGSAELTWNCRAEYDGFLRYDFSMPAGASGNGLQLRVPLKTELVTLYNMAQQYQGLLGSIPKGEGAILPRSFGYYTWLGNEELGICAIQEDDRGWIQPSRKGIVLERNGDVTTLVYNLAPKAFKLDKPWTFTFGLQATPVKPKPQGWRSWREESCVIRPTIHLLQGSAATDKYFGLPSPKNPAAFKNDIERYHEKGLKVLPYSAVMFISPYQPDYMWFRRDWRKARGDEKTGTHFAAHTFVCTVPSYVDFRVWDHVNRLDTFGYDGIYYDFAANPGGPGYAPDLGVGYDRDGKKIRGQPFFLTREMYKRIYTAFKERSEENLTWASTSSANYVPILSFVDIWMPGEGAWKGQLRDNYLEPDVTPLDVLRAKYMGHQFGAVPWFYSNWHTVGIVEDKDTAWRFPPPDKRFGLSVEKSHHFLGLGLLHDCNGPPWSGINGAAIVQFYGNLDRFGRHSGTFDEAQFFGYWNNQDLIGGQSEAIKVSAYRKPQGGSLFCVFNTTREARKATLTVKDWQDWQSNYIKKGNYGVWVADMYTDKRLDVDMPGNSITIDVPRLNYRLLWVR